MWWRLSGKQWAAAGAAVTLPSGADATQIIQDRQQLTAMLGCIFLFQEYQFLCPCFSFLPGFLRILFFSGGIFLQEPPFGWTSESRITPESPEYSGIPVPAK